MDGKREMNEGGEGEVNENGGKGSSVIHYLDMLQ